MEPVPKSLMAMIKPVKGTGEIGPPTMLKRYRFFALKRGGAVSHGSPCVVAVCPARLSGA